MTATTLIDPMTNRDESATGRRRSSSSSTKPQQKQALLQEQKPKTNHNNIATNNDSSRLQDNKENRSSPRRREKQPSTIVWRKNSGGSGGGQKPSESTSTTTATGASGTGGVMPPKGADNKNNTMLFDDDSFDDLNNHVDRMALMEEEVAMKLMVDIHQDDPKVVMLALERIAMICSGSCDLCSLACHMGAPVILVTTMRKWAKNKNIQAKGCEAMIALSVGSLKDGQSTSSSKSNNSVPKALWFMGGMETILTAMVTYPESRSVQFFGCNAILSLLPSGLEDATVSTWTLSDDKFKKRTSRRFVRDLHGVKTVNSAMIRFEKDRAMQEAGCSVLLKLATVLNQGTDRKLLLESGAVSAFSIALESHAKDDTIQQYTNFFMSVLSSGDVAPQAQY